MSGYTRRHLRVYVLDDHDIVRRGLQDLLAAKRDLTVVGESSSALAAHRQIRDLRPDVMLLDVHLQDGTGIDVCRSVRGTDPTIKGILLTASAEDEALIFAVLARADAFLVKLVHSTNIVDAVRAVGEGRTMFDPTSAGPLLATAIEDEGLHLSRQDQEYQSGLVDGLVARRDDAGIAAELDVPVRDVQADVAVLVRHFAGRVDSPPSLR